MFVNAISRITKSMFPIFRVNKISDNQMQIAVVGTGFFIDSKGAFVTVAHIFDDADKNSEFLYMGRLPEEIIQPPVKIIEVVKNDEKDIFVGRVGLKKTEPAVFANSVPSIGQSVCISGYPLAKLMPNNQGGIEVGGVRRYFQPTFTLDKVKAQVKNKNGKVRTHDGLLIRDFGLFGMSGGPVFNIKGQVVAMQASVTDPRVSTNGQRSITVENALAISGSIIRGIVSDAGISTGFIPRTLSRFV